MTETTAPSPKLEILKAKLEIVKGLLPSFNQSIVLIVTAVLGTIGTQRVMAPAPAPKIEIVKTVPVDMTSPKLAAIEQAIAALTAKVDALAAPKAAPRAKAK